LPPEPKVESADTIDPKTHPTENLPIAPVQKLLNYLH
jgi:hypothetical protein